MRRFFLFTLLGVLAAIVLARGLLPKPDTAVFAPTEGLSYNTLDLPFPGGEETAGSGIAGELSVYYTSRTPTEKHAYTGALTGKNLILVCADDWTPDPEDAGKNPALYRLARQSVKLGDVWRPEWYQGAEGNLFARVTGLVPTRIDDMSSLAYAAAQSISLPFSLPRAFARAGYDCRAYMPDDGLDDGLAALGFSSVETAEDLPAALDGAETPVFLFACWHGDGERALAELFSALSDRHRTDTVFCLLTADADPDRAQLYLWGAGLTGAASEAPCSELDLTPTLLDLFGLPFDSRLLSGRDILAAAGEEPLVTLRGSAFSDWVTAAGRYAAPQDTFTGTADDAYIEAMCLRVYRRYVYDRRAVECDYFRLLTGI